MNAMTQGHTYHYNFNEMDKVTIDGMPGRVTLRTEDGYVFVNVDGTGLSRMITHEELGEYGRRRLIHHEPGYFTPEGARRRLRQTATPISGLSDAQRVRANHRAAFVEALQELRRLGKVKLTDVSIREAQGEIERRARKYLEGLVPKRDREVATAVVMPDFPHPRTLRGWLKEYNFNGALGLVDRFHERGNRRHQRGPEAEALIAEAIEHFLDKEQPTIAIVYETLVASFHERNASRRAEGLHPLIIPAKETFRRRIRALSPYEVTLRRKGEAAARKEYAPVGQGLVVHRPLERVEIDEWTVDMISLMSAAKLDKLFTPEERLQIGLDNDKSRWVITMAICARTKCIVGLKISRNPKASAAVQTLEMVLSDKGRWADAVGALSPWDMHGTPEHIVTDGGPAFKSEAFRTACADSGISTERAVAGIPELRNSIERVFRTISRRLMPELGARTFSDHIEKGDMDPTKRAALTLEDFCFALTRWIVDCYHNTKHESLDGKTPLECWRELMHQYGVQAGPERRRWCLVFGLPMTRSITKEGIEVMGVHYHSRQIAEWRNKNENAQVEVRWHPSDIGAIEVRLGSDWVQAKAKHEGFDGLSAQAWKAARQMLRDADPTRNEFNRKAVSEALDAIRLRASDARLAVGLITEEWDPKRVENYEKRLFIGFKIADSKKPTKVTDGVGRSIPDPEPQQSEAPLPPKSATKPKRKANSKSAKATNWTVGD